MIKKFTILIGFLLVLAGFVNAEDIFDCQVLDEEGTEYILQNDINTNELLCIDIQANDITLDCNDHSINGNLIRNSEGIYAHGLNHQPIENIEVRNCAVSNWYTGINFASVRGSTIRDSDIYDNDMRGIDLLGENVEISGNNIENNGKYGIDLSGSSNNRIRDNNINHNNMDGQMNGYGIYLYNSNFNLINNNIIDNNDIGIYTRGEDFGHNGRDNIMTNNEITNGVEYGIYIHHGSNNHVINTLLQDNRVDFFVRGSTDNGCNQILDNVIGTNGLPILFFNGETHLGDVEASEIFLCNADDSTIDGITINNGEEQNNGIYLMRTENTILSDVNVDNSNDGIYLYNSNNNEVRYSSSTNNKNYGIHLYRSQNNEIHGNYFMENDDGGVYLDFADDNNIVNNVFNNVNNVENEDEDDDNSWNLPEIVRRGVRNIIGGPSLGGNYWATPNGNGFSQICNDFNRNGICDEGYQLDENNVDEFPLTIIGNNVPILTY